MKSYLILSIVFVFFAVSCTMPEPAKKKEMSVKHNYIVLLDLSDRLIIQEGQPERDKELVQMIYGLFEAKVKKDLYIRSRDEIKVVIAPQKGSTLKTDEYEDDMYINMDNIEKVMRRSKEAERKQVFNESLEKLYKKAVFSKNSQDYHGADIWKYFYEDLSTDISNDTLTQNYLFIVTDGYPIVGKDKEKLPSVKKKFPDLNVVLLEAVPREKDLEWDRLMALWTEWFEDMDVENYTLIKRKALAKVKDQVKDIVK